MAGRFAIAVVTGLLAVGGLIQPAFAGEAPDINAQSFEYTPGLHDGLYTRSARKQDGGDWTRSWLLGAGLHYTRRALTFVNSAGSSKLTQTILGDLWMVDLGGSVGYEAWTFEAALPMAVVTRGGGPDLVQVGDAVSPSFGDLRIGIRRWLWGSSIGGIGRVDVSLLLGYAAGTAAAGSWLGSGGKQGDGQLLLSWQKGGWALDINAGARLRDQAVIMVKEADPKTGKPALDTAGNPIEHKALVTGSLIVARAAIRRTIGDASHVAIGGQAMLPFGDVSTNQEMAEVFIDGGHALDDRGVLRAFIGGSAALTSGYGSAQFRVIAGVRIAPGKMANDSDGDGLLDRDDSCPNKAEDKDGFEDADGCPEPDNDGDGILDIADKCPLAPEDRDKFEDNDGCPDTDNDGDGVLDKDDRCPNAAEDRDKFDDHDGCPEPDNDGDGIPDVDDMCPTRPETRNGYDDKDGCPDGKAARGASLDGDRIVLPDKVQFVFSGGALTQAGRTSLDAVSNVLRAHPDVAALTIQVHTDDNGDAAKLVALSQLRAEAVRAYLAGKGPLSAAKIVAIGRGGKQPLTSNDTLAGRSRNRRVEFLVTARIKRAAAKADVAKPDASKAPTSKEAKPKPATPKASAAPAKPAVPKR